MSPTQRTPEIEQGKMYRVIDGVTTEMVLHGDEMLPANHWKVSQLIGQMVLFDVTQYSSNIAE
jgi:hypothetical protein